MELIPDEILEEILEIFDREKTKGEQVASTAYQLLLMIFDKPKVGELNGQLVKLHGKYVDMTVNLYEPKKEVIH